MISRSERDFLNIYKTALRLACEDVKDSKRFCPKYHGIWDCGKRRCPNAANEWSCWFNAYVAAAKKKIGRQ